MSYGGGGREWEEDDGFEEGEDEYVKARRAFERRRLGARYAGAGSGSPQGGLWNMRSSESWSAPSSSGRGVDRGSVPTKSDDAPQNPPSARQPRFGEMPSYASNSSSPSRSGSRMPSDGGLDRGGFGSDSTPPTRLEELSAREQFEQARQSRVSFQKMGKLFGGMVTRFLGIEDGKINYYDKRESKKRRGTYAFGPGARVKILDASKMDPESNDGLKPGTCWLRVQGLRRANGQEHTPILILTKNESEALLWKGAIEYARLLGRQSGREDVHEEEDMSEKQSELAAGIEKERRELRSFKNADDIRRERAALAKEAEKRRRMENSQQAGGIASGNGVRTSEGFEIAGEDAADVSAGNGYTNGSIDEEDNTANAAVEKEKKKKLSKKQERRQARKAAKEAKRRAKKAKKAARAAAYLARKDSAAKKRRVADGEEIDGDGKAEGDDRTSSDNSEEDAEEKSVLIDNTGKESGVRDELIEEIGKAPSSSSSSSILSTSHLPASMARMDTSRRLGTQNTAFYHRAILQITRHLQRRHHILQAEAKAKEAEREREEGELLNEVERDRRRRHLKSLKERKKRNGLNRLGLPADLLLPLENDGGKQDDMTLLRRARARRSGITREEAAVLEMENVLISFEDSMQPELNQFDERVLARTVVHVLSLLPQPLVPTEVWSMYKRTWDYSLEEARRREVIARKGHVLPDQLISRERRLEIVSELVEMLPMSNVRLLREVIGVVRVVCKTHRPWELGKRKYRPTDDTTNNLTPQFAQILLRGRFDPAGGKAWLGDGYSDGDDFREKSPATSLVKTLLKSFRKVFGILDNQGSSSSSEGEALGTDAEEEPLSGPDEEGDTETSALSNAIGHADFEGDKSTHEEAASALARKRSRSILKKKSSFLTASPEKSSNPRIKFANNLEQVRIIAPKTTEETSRGHDAYDKEEREDYQSDSSSDGHQGHSSDDDEAGDFGRQEDDLDEELSERDSNDWVDALEDRSSIDRTIESLSRLIVRYRTKIVQNGPYVRESASPEDLATVADWRKRVSVSELQLEKLRRKLKQIDEAATLLDTASGESHGYATRHAGSVVRDALSAGGSNSESSVSSDNDDDENDSDVMYTVQAAPNVQSQLPPAPPPQQQQQKSDTILKMEEKLEDEKSAQTEYAGSSTEPILSSLAPAIANSTSSSEPSAVSEELAQEQEMLMQTAEHVKRIWLDAQATELHKTRSSSPDEHTRKRRRSVHDLEEELRAGASKLEELSAAVTKVQLGVETREKRIGHQSIFTTSEVALSAASASTGLLRGYLPTLSIPSISSFTGWMPSFNATNAANTTNATNSKESRDNVVETNSEPSPSPSPGVKKQGESPEMPSASCSNSGGIDDVGSYVGLQRLLVELISENVKMRTQLNHYSEALLMPALEKDKEFRRQFQEAEVEASNRLEWDGQDEQDDQDDQVEDELVKSEDIEDVEVEEEPREDIQHRVSATQESTRTEGEHRSSKGKRQKKKNKRSKSHRKRKGVENARGRDGRLTENHQESSARIAAIHKQIKEEEDRLRIVLMREEAEKRRAEQDRAALTSSDDEASD